MSAWKSQLALVCLLVFATGWVVGVAKLSQVLMTSAGGRFVTRSEGRAEAFLLTFGLAKAVGNLVVGGAADTVGRQPCMVLGWGFGALFCLATLLAPSWDVVVAADLLLGLNQAFCWSVALFIAVDWLGPTQRARAVGLVETLGYSAVALASPLVGAVGVDGTSMLHVALLILSLGCAAASHLLLRETRALALGEAANSTSGHETSSSGNSSAAGGSGSERGGRGHAAERGAIVWPSGRRDEHSVVRLACAHVSCLDRALMASCLVGLALNFASAYAWGAMTRWLKRVTTTPDGVAHLGAEVGTVLMAYSMPKGLLQLPAGALADQRLLGCGPREFVILGLLMISVALGALGALSGAGLDAATTVAAALPLATLLGAGTAVAYSPVIACVVARAEPSWRSAAAGTYRFWRDLGFAAGGLLLGQAVDGAQGAPWVAPLLAAVAITSTAALFAWCYPREPPGAASVAVVLGGRVGVELAKAESSSPGGLLARDAPRSEAV